MLRKLTRKLYLDNSLEIRYFYFQSIIQYDIYRIRITPMINHYLNNSYLIVHFIWLFTYKLSVNERIVILYNRHQMKI